MTGLRSFAALAAVAAAAAVGCSKGKDSTPAPDAPFAARDVSGLSTPAFFELIPADSPLVMASFEPVPRVLTDKLGASLAPLAAALETELRAVNDPLVNAVLAELGSLDRAGLARVGLAPEARFAVYMIGPSFALRIELAGAAKLRAALDRIATASESAQRASLGGLDYWRVAQDELLVAAAVSGDELVVGAMHEAAAAEVLPVLFGQRKPAKSLADTGALRDIVGQYGLTGVGVGYFDVRALAAVIAGDGSALTQSVMAATGIDLALSPACGTEIAALAGIAPRFVFGYTKIGADRIDTLGVVELRPDLAKGLAGLTAPLPPLADVEPLFAFAVGIDADKAIAWSQERAAAVRAAPYACEHLGWINEGAEALAGGGADVPVLARDFRGAAIVVEDLEMAMGMPSRIEGHALLGMKDPQAALDQLAPLGIAAPADGAAPVPLELGTPAFGATHIARRGGWLGASIGDGSAETLAAALAAEPRSAGPAMVFAYDYSRYMKLLGDSVAAHDPNSRAMMEGVAGVFGVTRTEVYFTPRGIVMAQHMELGH